MRASHEAGSRTIKLTGLPTVLNDGHKPELTGLPDSLTICVNYSTDDPAPTLCKAVSLDNIVIPAIVAALNRRPPRKRQTQS